MSGSRICIAWLEFALKAMKSPEDGYGRSCVRLGAHTGRLRELSEIRIRAHGSLRIVSVSKCCHWIQSASETALSAALARLWHHKK